MEAFVSVYVDMAATADGVRIGVAELLNPKGVFEVTVDCNSVTDTFGCRIAVNTTAIGAMNTPARDVAGELRRPRWARWCKRSNFSTHR